MAIKKNATQVATGTENKAVSEIKVLKCRSINDTTYAIDIEVNGIKIYGCFYREGVKDGREWSLVSLPQTKGKDSTGATKYYDIVWFPISKDMVKDVAKQIETMI